MRLRVDREFVTEGKRALRKTCKAGHRFTKINTYVNPDGKRRCRICRDAKAKLRTEEIEPGESCHKCALKLGAKVPKRGQNSITVHGGICYYCKLPGTIIPHCDFDWPASGERAIWD